MPFQGRLSNAGAGFLDAPVHIGDVILKDVAGTGVDVVATKNVE